MKKLALAIVLLAAGQNAAAMTRGRVPANVKAAVDYIYQAGRNQADTGGIKTLALYKVNNEPLFQVISTIMYVGRTEPARIAKTACETESAPHNLCVRKVISGEISANNPYHDIYDFINEMDTWDTGNPQWTDSLKTVREYTQRTIGEGFAVYSYGYDDTADIFTIIMVSADGKKVLVFTADYGA